VRFDQRLGNQVIGQPIIADKCHLFLISIEGAPVNSGTPGEKGLAYILVPQSSAVEVMAELTAPANAEDPRQIPCAA
jgi:hypothetical protein